MIALLANILKKKHMDPAEGSISFAADELTSKIVKTVQQLVQLQKLNPDHVEFEDLRKIVGSSFSSDLQAHQLLPQLISAEQNTLSLFKTQFVEVAGVDGVRQDQAELMFQEIVNNTKLGLQKEVGRTR